MALSIVGGHDNGRYMFADRQDANRCSRCHNLLDKWGKGEFRLDGVESLDLDISITYDGAVIVSPRFRAVVAEAGLVGLEFEELGSGFAMLRVSRRVRFDSEARGTRFECRCTLCGQFESVAGATPAFLKDPAEVGEKEFVRTDLEFGSGDEKSPLLICGEMATAALTRAQLRGLDVLVDVRRA